MATPVTTVNGQKPAARSAAAKLRALLSDPSRMLVAPGVYDGLTARIALREGFDCESFPRREKSCIFSPKQIPQLAPLLLVNLRLPL